MSYLGRRLQPPRYSSRRRAQPAAIVVSRSLLIREALSRRLSTLGIHVAAVSRFDTLARELEGLSPDLVLIDGDGWERPWEALIRDLHLRSRGVQALLLISSMNVGQAFQTPSLGIDAVILKPFKAEEHTARVYDQLLEARGVTPQRENPRYRLPPTRAVELEFLPDGDWVVLRLPVLDISAGGALLELPMSSTAARLKAGERMEVCSLLIDGTRISLTIRVVHSDRTAAGVVFEHLDDRKGTVRAMLQDLDCRVFGSSVPRRLW